MNKRILFLCLLGLHSASHAQSSQSLGDRLGQAFEKGLMFISIALLMKVATICARKIRSGCQKACFLAISSSTGLASIN